MSEPEREKVNVCVIYHHGVGITSESPRPPPLPSPKENKTYKHRELQPQTDRGSLARRNPEIYEVCDQELEIVVDIVDLYAVPSITCGIADCRS